MSTEIKPIYDCDLIAAQVIVLVKDYANFLNERFGIDVNETITRIRTETSLEYGRIKEEGNPRF